MATNGNSLQMPSTITPSGVIGGLVLLAGLGCVLLCTLFSSVILDWGWFWGVIVVTAIFAFTTEYYTETVPGYFGRILLNHLDGKQRTIFQGLHPKLPWESVTRDVDLRVDLKDVLSETYASLDALMETKYVYTMRPQLTGEAVILYSSFESDALKQSIRALLSMLLSDYYGRKHSKDLLDKLKINREVFLGEEPERLPEQNGLLMIKDFERTHGVVVTARLEDSDPDKATQDARDTVARATSFGEAVNELTAKGVSPEEAVKIAKMMQIPGVQEFIVSLSAKGIENLRDVTLLPPPGLGGKGGKK